MRGDVAGSRDGLGAYYTAHLESNVEKPAVAMVMRVYSIPELKGHGNVSFFLG